MAEQFAMPILGGRHGLSDVGSFEWEPTERDLARAFDNHGQSLRRLKERGGVSWSELRAILEDREWRTGRAGDDDACRAIVTARSNATQKEPDNG